MSAQPTWMPAAVHHAVGDGEAAEWEALRRVQGAEVTVTGDGYSIRPRNGASPITGDLAGPLDGLLAAGCVALGLPDPGGHRLVSTTVAGEIRYAQLFERWPR